jgi:hypothetical protein
MKKTFIWPNNTDLNGGGGRKAHSGDWGEEDRLLFSRVSKES